MNDTNRSAGGMAGNAKGIWKRIKTHNVVVAAAGIAFYGLLALVPTLIALVSIYGLVADPSDVESLVSDAAGSIDDATEELLRTQLNDIISSSDNGSDTGALVGRWVALVLSIGLALFSASGAVQKLIGTIGVAYEATETRPGWKLRGMAYGFTAAAIVGVALMVLTIVVAPSLLDELDLSGSAEAAINVLIFPALGILFAGALTVLYRYGPDRSSRTPWRNPGAVVATLLFIFFAVAFSIYSTNVGLMPASYGLLGSIAALMIFLQLTAVAVIVGAEVNAAVEVGALEDERAAAGLRTAPAGASDPDGGRGTVGFGKALAGLVALFVLARAGQDD